MKTAVRVFGGLAFVCAALMADTVCVSGTLASYEALGATGCSVGPINFFNFGFATAAMSGGAVPVDATEITVSPVTAPDSYGLNYASTGFQVSTGQFIQYLLTYTSDPQPPIIHGFAMQMFVDGPVFPGEATVASEECLGFAFSGATCAGSTVSQSVFDNGITSSLTSVQSFPPVDTLGDRTTITLDASSGGSAEFTSFSESVLTPEPAPGPLVGAALFVLAWRSRHGQRSCRRCRLS
jgi:hypothetical protein